MVKTPQSIVTAVQWNPEAKVYLEAPKLEGVRGTSYSEVWGLLGTSGCSKNEPYYTWSCLGVVESEKGKQLVSPGDWIVDVVLGVRVVMTDVQYQEWLQLKGE